MGKAESVSSRAWASLASAVESFTESSKLVMQMHQVGPSHRHGKVLFLHISDDWTPSTVSQKKRISTEIECMWHAVLMCGVCVCVCVCVACMCVCV